MKIAIGYRLQSGPWGGGNQFAHSLTTYLESCGHTVRFDLRDNDLDLILLTDPRWRAPNVSFGAGAILWYLMTRNPSTLVVHRINECDERKGTHNMNRLLRWANYCADHTVFIASWLEHLNIWGRNSPHSTILNGADHKLFRGNVDATWSGDEPLKLVTHHWGGNHMKGFDVYKKIDQMLSDPAWKGKIEFTYIGNLPKGYQFKNAFYLPPLQGGKLSAELARHHVYVTASINEPAGMHHIEGALCGLPIIYRRSGALPEYCQDFGIGFDKQDFIPALKTMLEDYMLFKRLMPSYPHTSERMCAAYITLFERMLLERAKVLEGRRLWRSPTSLLRNLVLI
jgi:hypothetical protein